MSDEDNLNDLLWQAASATPGMTCDVEISVDAGQRVQMQILERYEQRGDRCAGYKIGLTSGASRDAFGPGIRPFGFVLASRICASGATLALRPEWRYGLENELVFRVDHALVDPAHAGAQTLRDVVTSVAPGFEINHHRLSGHITPGVRVADNLSQWGMVTGTFLPVADVDFDAIEVSLARGPETVETTAAAGHIDDHFESLATLARRLAAFGRELNVGDLIITGSFTRQSIDQAGPWTGTFSGVGAVSVEIALHGN